MLISEKTTGSIYFFFFFASKEAYPLVRQLEKITVKKAQAKVVKCPKTNLGSLGTPLGHLCVNYVKTMLLVKSYHVFTVAATCDYDSPSLSKIL